MSRLALGVLCGLIYGALSAASMIPLQFPDKHAALLGAFINRFSIGFVIGAVAMPSPRSASGSVMSILMTRSAATMTMAYARISTLGPPSWPTLCWVGQRFGPC